jgi:hypothetical protein
MKQKHSKLTIVLSFLMFILMVSFVASKSGANPLLLAGGIIAFALLFPRKENNLVCNDGVYTEAWLGELVKRFRFKREWLGKIPRYGQAAKNKVIHLVDIGADPEVYVNLLIDKDNPVPIAHRADADIPITLDKFDTQNTMVTLDELRSISYDKMAVTLDLHMNAISDKAAVKAAQRLAASSDAYIKATTGAADGRAVSRKRLTPDDMVMMTEVVSTPLDEGGVDWPEGEGVAVLDHRHVADLQKLDQHFEKQWKDAKTGQLFDYNGWQIMKFNRNARYTEDGDGTFTIVPFNTAYDAATQDHSSLFFLPQRAFAAADATPEMFYKIKSTDPEYRANTVGFQHWNVVAKKKADGFFQLVSPRI